jgi:hypothetical protein
MTSSVPPLPLLVDPPADFAGAGAGFFLSDFSDLADVALRVAEGGAFVPVFGILFSS